MECIMVTSECGCWTNLIEYLLIDDMNSTAKGKASKVKDSLLQEGYTLLDEDEGTSQYKKGHTYFNFTSYTVESDGRVLNP